jgi:hypothetical protein
MTAQAMIRNEQDRDRVASRIGCMEVPRPMTVTIDWANKRTNEQNDRMWAMLRDISRQVEWHGQMLSPEEWKDVFSASLGYTRIVPGLDGQFVQLGARTSRMSKARMSELVELMFAFGAEYDVRWKDENPQNGG